MTAATAVRIVAQHMLTLITQVEERHKQALANKNTELDESDYLDGYLKGLCDAMRFINTIGQAAQEDAQHP